MYAYTSIFTYVYMYVFKGGNCVLTHFPVLVPAGFGATGKSNDFGWLASAKILFAAAGSSIFSQQKMVALPKCYDCRFITLRQ